MADNFLERRMADLQAGRLGKSAHAAPQPGPRKGTVSYPFPTKRVLVVGALSGAPLAIAKAFAKTGCKVVVTGSDPERGNALAYSDGFRYINIADGDAEALAEGFQGLLKAWRDVDVVVCLDNGDAKMLARLWEEHRRRFPIPSEYGGRVILLRPSDLEPSASALASTLSFGATVNTIRISPEVFASESPSVARAAIFLALPGNESISCSVISIASGNSAK